MKNIKAWLDDHPVIKQILFYTVCLFHIVLSLFMNVFVFFTNDIRILFAIIIVNSSIILHWYIFGDCMLKPLEHILGDKQEKNNYGTEIGIFYRLIPEFLRPFIRQLLTLFPWLAIVFASYKIYISKTICPPRR